MGAQVTASLHFEGRPLNADDDRSVVVLVTSSGNRSTLLSVSRLLSLSKCIRVLLPGTGPMRQCHRGLAALNDRVSTYDVASADSAVVTLTARHPWINGCHAVVEFPAGEYDPSDVSRALAALARRDVVIGSRFCTNGAELGASRLALATARLCNRLGARACRSPIRDLTSPFRCWRRSAWNKYVGRQAGQLIRGQLDVNVDLLRSGFRIVELPVLRLVRHGSVYERLRRIRWRDLRCVLRTAATVRSRAVRGFVARRFRRDEQTRVGLEPRRQILFLALGGIGDTVLAFAAARKLRARFPDDRIVAMAMWPQSAELLEDLGVFDDVQHHHFQQEGFLRSLRVLFQLRRRRFDISLIAFPANRFEYNVAHRLIGAKQRIGHDYLLGSNLTYLRWLLTDRVKQIKGTHNVDENLRLLTALGADSEPGTPDISLGPIAPEYRSYADARLRGLGQDLLGIHAGSSSYKGLDGKRWPAEKFAELCVRVVDELGMQPLLFGTRQDRAINEIIRDWCPSAQIIETPSIRHSAAVLQRCGAFVSNDSALAHLATALDVPTIMLVGPTDSDEVGPYSSKGVALSPTRICAPCFRVSRRPMSCQHPTPFACMRDRNIEEVMRYLLQLLTSGISSAGLQKRSGERCELGTPFERPCVNLVSLAIEGRT